MGWYGHKNAYLNLVSESTDLSWPAPWTFRLKSRRTSYLHRGLSQGGNRITVEVLLTGFLFAYDVVMSGLWHGQSRLPTEVHRSGLSASRWTSVGLGQSQGYEERQPHAHVGVFGQSTMDVSRLFLPELRVARLLTWKQWRWQSCKPAQRATFGDYLSAECERLRGGDSLSSEAMAVEDADPAKADNQDCLKALGASIANLEKARRQAGCGCRRGSSAEEAGETGAQGSDAVPQVYQGPLESGDSGKGKGGHQAQGFAEGGDGSAAAAVAEITKDFGCKERSRREGARGRNAAGDAFGRGRLRRVVFSCLIFCILLRATVTSAVGAWTCGVALRGRSGQVRGVVQQRRDRGQGVSGSTFGGSEPATSLPADPVSSTPIAATSAGSAFRAAKAPFPSAAPYAAGFQMSKSQERPLGADQFVNAVAQPLPDADVQAGVRRRGQSVLRLAQRSRTPELCTMADFSRRVPLDELRGRGLMKGLQPEVLE